MKPVCPHGTGLFLSPSLLYICLLLFLLFLKRLMARGQTWQTGFTLSIHAGCGVARAVALRFFGGIFLVSVIDCSHIEIKLQQGF